MSSFLVAIEIYLFPKEPSIFNVIVILI